MSTFLDKTGLDQLIAQLASHDLSNIKVGNSYQSGADGGTAELTPAVVRINPNDDMFLVLAIPSGYGYNNTNLYNSSYKIRSAVFLKTTSGNYIRTDQSATNASFSICSGSDLVTPYWLDGYTSRYSGGSLTFGEISYTTSMKTLSNLADDRTILPATTQLNQHFVKGADGEYWVTCNLPDTLLLYIPLKDYTECLREDTLIPLEDGTVKTIAEIVQGDKVAFYNTNNKDPNLRYNLVCVPSVSTLQDRYQKFIFEDGSELNIAGNHMIYNVEQDKILGSLDWTIGLHALNLKNEPVKLVSIETVQEARQCKFYNIYCRHYKYFANGILCGHSQGVLYDEFMKPANEKYRFKNQEYMSHLRRKSEERLMAKGFVPKNLRDLFDEVDADYLYTEQEINEAQEYLNSTDYKIVRQLSNPVLTEEEYTKLEESREAARERIRNIRSKLKERDQRKQEIREGYLDTISPKRSVM